MEFGGLKAIKKLNHSKEGIWQDNKYFFKLSQSMQDHLIYPIKFQIQTLLPSPQDFIFLKDVLQTLIETNMYFLYLHTTQVILC